MEKSPGTLHMERIAALQHRRKNKAAYLLSYRVELKRQGSTYPFVLVRLKQGQASAFHRCFMETFSCVIFASHHDITIAKKHYGERAVKDAILTALFNGTKQ